MINDIFANVTQEFRPMNKQQQNDFLSSLIQETHKHSKKSWKDHEVEKERFIFSLFSSSKQRNSLIESLKNYYYQDDPFKITPGSFVRCMASSQHPRKAEGTLDNGGFVTKIDEINIHFRNGRRFWKSALEHNYLFVCWSKDSRFLQLLISRTT